IRNQSRASITASPMAQTAARAAPRTLRRATVFPTSSSGRAQDTSGGRKRSMSTPAGSTKLIEVATQIQYFVVALIRRDEVTAQAASATKVAKARWISAARIRRANVGS